MGARPRATLEARGAAQPEEVVVVMSYLPWVAAGLMLLAAVMLVLSDGPVGVWIAVVTVGVGILAIDGVRNTRHHPHA